MKRFVALIDDDTVGLHLHLAELRIAGFTAQLFSSVFEIRSILDGTLPTPPDFFVTDLMMPSHDLFPDEPPGTSFHAGLIVARDLRARYASTPIVVWSSIPQSDLRATAARHSAELPLCIFASKHDVSPWDLTRIVKRYFERGELKLPERPPSFWRRLWRAITLRPSFAGVGIDLKKLSDDRNA